MSANTLQLNPRTVNLSGRKFGLLTVIGFAGYRRSAYWLCRCECGNEKAVAAHNLTRGHHASCGCGMQFRVESPVESQPEFDSYSAMIDRCHNPNSKSWGRYGGRGITVCEKWRQGFWFFVDDMGPRPSPLHSLDRFPDRNGNYEPGNVRWATPKQQQRNRNVTWEVEFRGGTKPLSEWAELLGLNYRTVQARIWKRGWTVEQALTTPTDGPNKFSVKHKPAAPRKLRLSPEQIAEMQRRWMAGETTRALAEVFGVGKSVAHKIVARQGPYAPAKAS
jgi:hypothetical protein